MRSNISNERMTDADVPGDFPIALIWHGLERHADGPAIVGIYWLGMGGCAW